MAYPFPEMRLLRGRMIAGAARAKVELWSLFLENDQMRIGTAVEVIFWMAMMIGGASAGSFEDGVKSYANKDYADARKAFLAAAALDDPRAQLNLGLIYFNGHGVAQDFRQAASWYRKSSLQGNVKAQYNLGLMYTNGQGVSQDYEQAANWYRKAAAEGDARAQYNLGLMYSQGLGLAQEFRQAAVWYRKAADQAYVGAQVNLGVMYANGQGMAQDLVQAHKWFDVAAAQGDEQARRNRENLEHKMPSEQVAEAKRQAGIWLKALGSGQRQIAGGNSRTGLSPLQ
jgi:TPR repeat protein